MNIKKTRVCLLLTFLLLLSLCFCPVAFAAQETSGSAIIPVTSSGIYGGTEVQFVGSVTPTIMSLTMPSTVMFDMNKNTANPNKVLSPEIKITNNSYQEVTVYASNTYVDLSNMYGTVYANSISGSAMYITNGAITIQNNEIAVGISSEFLTGGALTIEGLDNTMWLIEGMPSGPLTTVSGNSSASVYVVGAVGNSVPENQFFRVVPTLVATYWAN